MKKLLLNRRMHEKGLTPVVVGLALAGILSYAAVLLEALSKFDDDRPELPWVP